MAKNSSIPARTYTGRGGHIQNLENSKLILLITSVGGVIFTSHRVLRGWVNDVPNELIFSYLLTWFLLVELLALVANANRFFPSSVWNGIAILRTVLTHSTPTISAVVQRKGDREFFVTHATANHFRVGDPIQGSNAILYKWFRVVQNCSYCAQSGDHLLRDFPSVHILRLFGDFIVGIGIFSITVIADADRRMPISKRNTFLVGGTLRTKAFAARPAMMLRVRWSKHGFTFVTMFNFVVRPPVWRCYLIGNPRGQHFCRL